MQTDGFGPDAGVSIGQTETRSDWCAKSLHPAGTRPIRMATRPARPEGLRPSILTSTAGRRGKHRQLLVELDRLASGALQPGVRANQQFEVGVAVLAGVFEDRQGVLLCSGRGLNCRARFALRRDAACEMRSATHASAVTKRRKTRLQSTGWQQAATLNPNAAQGDLAGEYPSKAHGLIPNHSAVHPLIEGVSSISLRVRYEIQLAANTYCNSV